MANVLRVHPRQPEDMTARSYSDCIACKTSTQSQAPDYRVELPVSWHTCILEICPIHSSIFLLCLHPDYD